MIDETNVEQPSWCDYPDASLPVWGCWSLLTGRVVNEDFCKGCELYKKKEMINCEQKELIELTSLSQEPVEKPERIIAAAYKVKPEYVCECQLIYKHPSLQEQFGQFDDIYELRIARHHAEIIHMYHNEIEETSDGFYTSYGRYVDRYEAARIALACGQCKEPLIMGNRLDSSDVF